MFRVQKRDQRIVPFELEKLVGSIQSARSGELGGSVDPGAAPRAASLAEELAAEVSRRAFSGHESGGRERGRSEAPEGETLERGSDGRCGPVPAVSAEELGRLVEEVLAAEGQTSAATAFANYRRQRERKRQGLGVYRDPDAQAVEPWNREKLVASLMRGADLGAERARRLAATVEARVLACGLDKVSSSFLRELTDCELLDRGFRVNLHRPEPIGLAAGEVEGLLFGTRAGSGGTRAGSGGTRAGSGGTSEPDARGAQGEWDARVRGEQRATITPWEGSDRRASRERLREVIAARVLERYSLAEVHSRAVAEAHRDGRLFLHGLAQPLEVARIAWSPGASLESRLRDGALGGSAGAGLGGSAGAGLGGSAGAGLGGSAGAGLGGSAGAGLGGSAGAGLGGPGWSFLDQGDFLRRVEELRSVCSELRLVDWDGVAGCWAAGGDGPLANGGAVDQPELALKRLLDGLLDPDRLAGETAGGLTGARSTGGPGRAGEGGRGAGDDRIRGAAGPTRRLVLELDARAQSLPAWRALGARSARELAGVSCALRLEGLVAGAPSGALDSRRELAGLLSALHARGAPLEWRLPSGEGGRRDGGRGPAGRAGAPIGRGGAQRLARGEARVLVAKTTINLPRLACRVVFDGQRNLELELDRLAELTVRSLAERRDIIVRLLEENLESPLRAVLAPLESVRGALRDVDQGALTFGVGLLGLDDCVRLLTGEAPGERSSARDFSLGLVDALRDRLECEARDAGLVLRLEETRNRGELRALERRDHDLYGDGLAAVPAEVLERSFLEPRYSSGVRCSAETFSDPLESIEALSHFWSRVDLRGGVLDVTAWPCGSHCSGEDERELFNSLLESSWVTQRDPYDARGRVRLGGESWFG